VIVLVILAAILLVALLADWILASFPP